MMLNVFCLSCVPHKAHHHKSPPTVYCQYVFYGTLLHDSPPALHKSRSAVARSKKSVMPTYGMPTCASGLSQLPSESTLLGTRSPSFSSSRRTTAGGGALPPGSHRPTKGLPRPKGCSERGSSRASNYGEKKARHS